MVIYNPKKVELIQFIVGHKLTISISCSLALLRSGPIFTYWDIGGGETVIIQLYCFVLF